MKRTFSSLNPTYIFTYNTRTTLLIFHAIHKWNTCPLFSEAKPVLVANKKVLIGLQDCSTMVLKSIYSSDETYQLAGGTAQSGNSITYCKYGPRRYCYVCNVTD